MEIEIGLDRNYYTFVVNDTFAHAADLIHHISTGQTVASEESQVEARRVAKQIVIDTKAYLAK